MQNHKSNQLLVKEGLLYDEFIIKGDNDYIEFCDHIMIKYNEMLDKHKTLQEKYKKCNKELVRLKQKKSREVFYEDLIQTFYEDKLETLTKKENMITKRMCIMNNKNKRLIEYYKNLLDLEKKIEMKELRLNYRDQYTLKLNQELKKIRFTNRIMRIKLLKAKKNEKK